MLLWDLVSADYYHNAFSGYLSGAWCWCQRHSLAHPGSPGLRAVKRLCVCVCDYYHNQQILNLTKGYSQLHTVINIISSYTDNDLPSLQFSRASLVLSFIYDSYCSYAGLLGSRVVSVLDSGVEGPGFKLQSWRCRVTVLGKLLTPIVPLFTKQQNW